MSDDGFPFDGEIFHSIANPIYLLDGDGEILDVNEAATERYGYSRSEFRELHLTDVRSEEPSGAQSNAIDRVQRALAGTPQEFEWQAEDSDGNTCHEEVSLERAIVDGDRRVVATVRDSEQRKQYERKLEEERERHSSLVEQSPDGIVIVQDGEFKFVNPAMTELTGRSESALLGRPFYEVIAPEYHDLVKERYEKRIRGENPPEQYEIEVLTADNERRYVDLAVSSITYRGDPATLATFTDITARKRIEQDLGDRESKFRMLAENLDTVVWLYDPADDRVVYVNPAYEEVWGQPKESLYENPRAYVDGVHPEDRDSVLEALSTQEMGDYSEEYRVVRPDGTVRWVSDHAIPIHDEDGEVFRIAGIAEDITERKRREQELESYEVLFENTSDCIVEIRPVDGEPIIERVNAAFEEVFGYPESELRGRNLDDVIVPEGAREKAREIGRRVQEGELVTAEVTRTTADGPREFLLRSVNFRDEFFYGIYTDITDRKQREQELQRQNERLEKFAGVVSHDLRNPLNVARGHLAMIEGERTAVIDRNLDRMEAIIDSLLTLAKQGQAVDETEAIHLGEYAEQCWTQVATGEATLVVESDVRLQADPDRFRRLLENLFRNSVEHAGSEVTIHVGSLPDGFYVADDGPGIPEEKREQIFEHGFTTAESGTGFGLNIVEEIVRAHGWTIRVTEGEAGGARFEFTGVRR